MSIIPAANPSNHPVAVQPARSFCSQISGFIKRAVKIGMAVLIAAPFAAATPSQAICPPRPFSPFTPDAVHLGKCRESDLCEMKGEEFDCPDFELRKILTEGREKLNRGLWDQVEQNGPATFRFDSKVQLGGQLIPETREILIPFPSGPTSFWSKTAMHNGLIELRNRDLQDIHLSNVRCQFKFQQTPIEIVRKTLLNNPMSRKLLEEVTEQAPFTFRCATLAEANGPAMVKLREREILIATQNPTEIFHAMVMELSNLKRARPFFALEKCDTDAFTYARETERVEYEALKETNEILNACREQGLVTVGANPFAPFFNGESKSADFRTFESYLSAQRVTGHTGFYQDQYEQRCASGRWSHFSHF